MFTHFWKNVDTQVLAEGFCRFGACGDESLEVGSFFHEFSDVGRFDDFEKFVRSVTGFSYNRCSSVEEADGMPLAMVFYFIDFKGFVFNIDEMVFVVIENETLDAPVIIDKVRIEKFHAPAFSRRRETSEKENACCFMDEGCQRVD